MRKRFDEELKTLEKEMISLGSSCEEIIYRIIKLSNSDTEVSFEDIDIINTEIEENCKTIENSCIKLLIKEQPVATDFRNISSALKMITDMRRIGDQALDIAEILEKTENYHGKAATFIEKMLYTNKEMLGEVVNSFINKDYEMANNVIEKDDIIDEYFIKIKSNLIESIIKEPSDGETYWNLFMISKYCERIGDHIVNVANWVIFSIDGIFGRSTK